jgi:hypothetical protein
MSADMMFKIRAVLTEAVMGITKEEMVGIVRRRLVSTNLSLDVVDVPVGARHGGWYVQAPDMTTLAVVVYAFPYCAAAANLALYVPDETGPTPPTQQAGEWHIPYHLAEDPVAEMIDAVIAVVREQMDVRRQNASARWAQSESEGGI